MRNKLARTLAIVTCFGGIALEADAGQVQCERIPLDSVEGGVAVQSNKIEGLARSHGLTGVVDFILVKIPDRENGITKIRRLVLIADVFPAATVECHAGPDLTNKPATMCARSIPTRGVKLIVTYEPDSPRDLTGLTDQLVKYVMDEVLNCRLGSV